MDKNSFDLITFGEIMLRLSPPRHARIVDGDIFEKRAGGAELNVASGVALLGLRTGIVSKLPQNELGTFIKNRIRFVGVSDDYLVYDDTPDARLGLYYYEMGAAPRKPTIVYDRHQASVTRIKMSEIPEDIYHSARMFHTSGISLALCQNMQNVAVELIRRFKSAGATISFDVNYRANLWGEEEARKTIEEILPLVDVLFVSEETSRRMFKKTGDLKDIMKSYATDYGVKIVATTQRTVISPRKHNFTSIVYDARSDKFYTEAPYNDIDVIGKKMTIAGAGGAATAIQVQCALDGAESISIFNPKDPFFARAESTAEKLSKETPDCKVSVFDLADEAKLKEEVANADILVNATLAGMKPHEEITLIKDKSMFRPDLVVADVVYNPAETRMVKEAKEAGCKLAIGGKGMLLWQGAAAYKLYTGLEMPTAEYQKFQEENENK